jgi:Zn-dependent membrane protease YugP
MYFGDWTYILVLPAIALALFAQFRVKSTYAKYARVAAASGVKAADTARALLNQGGAGQIPVDKVPGQLTDHYDPRKKILRLSEGVYESSSIAALGIAAHEAGHALQHNAHYGPLMLRNGFFPVVSIGSTLAFPLFFIGFIAGAGGRVLMDIGILLFTFAVFFSVITLPVEFDASKRAVALLEERGFLNRREIGGAKAVLSAAALTYVAATAMAIFQLVRLLVLRDSRD